MNQINIFGGIGGLTVSILVSMGAYRILEIFNAHDLLFFLHWFMSIAIIMGTTMLGTFTSLGSIGKDEVKDEV